MTGELTVPPANTGGTFLEFPLACDLDDLQADFAILGIPYGAPYHKPAIANDQSTAPDAIRHAPTAEDIEYTRNHYDWDLGGHLFAEKDIRVVGCGNVSAGLVDHRDHYQRGEQAARKIYGSGAILIALGGDHGISIPAMRALEVADARAYGADLISAYEMHDVGTISMIHAERLICSFIGASIRAGHCG